VVRLATRLLRMLSLRELPLRVEDDGDHAYIRVRGIAGTLYLAGREVDVAPKYLAQNATGWREALITMIERAAPRRAAYVPMRRVQLKYRTFIDQFAYAFALQLEVASRSTPLRTYRARGQELAVLRGRLLVAEQLRMSLLRPHRVRCEVDELDTDNPTNRLLHWVGQQLLAQVHDAQLRRKLSHHLARLPSVPTPVRLPVPLVVTVPRQYAHYDGAVSLALAYVRGRTTYPAGTNAVDGVGFVIGTERLFESFVERTLHGVLSADPSLQVHPQVDRLFAKPIGGGRGYYSRPDNVVELAGKVVLVVDAKYKNLGDAADAGAVRQRPVSADLYQMAAALMAHACDRALLIYPGAQQHDDGQAWMTRWWSVPALNGLVGAVIVELSMLGDPSTLASFDAKIATVVDGALTFTNGTALT
jgi:5-methylcytosine-specific restriction endonuclease McrBC regulatory subunit McrC